MASSGRVAKYAAGPPATHGSPCARWPALSGVGKSITFTATRSSAMRARPPARPSCTIAIGSLSSTSRITAGIASVWCTGSTALRTTAWPTTRPVQRLGDLRRWVDRVPGEGLEARDEDHASWRSHRAKGSRRAPECAMVGAITEKGQSKRLAREIGIYVGLAPFLVIALFPVLWMVITAFKQEQDLYRMQFPLWFHLPPTLRHFR